MLWLRWLVLAVASGRGASVCRRVGSAPPPELSRDGDVNIGGVFSFRTGQDYAVSTFRTIPEMRKCKKEFKFAQVMIFAIKEINQNPRILSNIKLGYKIYDNCGTMDILRAALALISGPDGETCAERQAVQAVLGHSGSRPTIGFAPVVGIFKIPVISHFATCACLSDRSEYPTFFRTIPSDYYQSRALAKLLRHFGWTWIGAIAVENEYGLGGIAAFAEAAREHGVCIEYSAAFSSSGRPEKLRGIVRTVEKATSKVILAFMSHREVKLLAKELHRKNITDLQLVGSDAWITDHSLADGEGHGVLAGAVGFTVSRARIAGFGEHLRSLRPEHFPESRFVRDFWEHTFDCSLNGSAERRKRPCSGSESLRNVDSRFTDVSELRFTNNVYKAVYSVAHALDDLARCAEGGGPFANGSCADVKDIRPWQVLRYLSAVSFTTKEGERVYFDGNGDSPARYELVNLRMTKKGTMEGVTVGIYDASLPENAQFIMSGVPIVWGDGRSQAPASVCSGSCFPGTRKVLQKGRPVCCYDCVPCPAGEISNQTDSIGCLKCPPEFWSNEDRDACVRKKTEFLSYRELLGNLLATFSLLGVFITTVTTLIFYCHRETPIVRANNSELSFLMLFSLTLCFLCSLTFMGRPSGWSCMLRHTAFGITFVLCISCVLGKTILVLMAFKATLPGSNLMKWFGPVQQRLSVWAFTSVQVVICTLWLTVDPPYPSRNMEVHNDRIILECRLGSAAGFWAALGYIGLLALFCFVLAFLARKLPDNFNEAKLITFSMLIFCAVWITFVPAYVSSPGKFTVAVEIFAILASSYGLLFCIFLPKCFIILFRPEKNTKKHIMGKSSNNDSRH